MAAQSANLTFDDEFSGSQLNVWNNNSGRWQYSYYWSSDGYGATPSSWWVGYSQTPAGGGSLPDPITLNNGVLSINFMPTPPSDLPLVNNTPFLTDLLTTYHSFSQQYGYFEMNAQLPAAPGLNSAFWLLPESGAWSPEVDVEEYLGNDPTTLWMTVHVTDPKTGKLTSYPHPRTIPDASKGFHTYAVDLEKSTITWYFDGKQEAKQTSPPSTAPGLNVPMYILTDITSGTAGDGWAGPPVSGETARMNINYIHAYTSKPSSVATAVQQTRDPRGTGDYR